jgi:peptide/nickel transport system ATP-binding protein
MPEQEAIQRGSFVEVRDVIKHYPVRTLRSGRAKVRSVDGVNLSIRQGEVLGLVGESGCGKSTLARLIINQLPFDQGSIMVDGQDITRLKGADLKRFRRSIQLVFQDPVGALDPRMRIGQSLEAPLAQHGIGDRQERRQRIAKMLGEVGLDLDLTDSYPRQCSGGQLQRVVIARALLLEPRFLICDEPTSALDASVRAQILNLLTDLKKRFDLTLLMISHDLRALRHICDRVAVMYLGEIVEIGNLQELFTRPAHPYTRGLLAASTLEQSGLEVSSQLVRGEPPSPINPPPGCRFHPRCPLAKDRCSREPPALEEIGAGQSVSCHFWDSGTQAFKPQGPFAGSAVASP